MFLENIYGYKSDKREPDERQCGCLRFCCVCVCWASYNICWYAYIGMWLVSGLVRGASYKWQRTKALRFETAYGDRTRSFFDMHPCFPSAAQQHSYSIILTFCHRPFNICTAQCAHTHTHTHNIPTHRITELRWKLPKNTNQCPEEFQQFPSISHGKLRRTTSVLCCCCCCLFGLKLLCFWEPTLVDAQTIMIE